MAFVTSIKRIIKICVIIWFVFHYSTATLFAQYGTEAQVRNVDFELINGKIIITYDLIAKPNEVFDIDVNVFNSANNAIKAETIEGEFSDIRKGKNKKIIWHISKDFLNFEDNIYVVVTAHHKNYKLHPKVTKLDAIWKSTLWPGWGSAQTTLNKSNYAKGFLGYGSLVSSVYLYDFYKQKNKLAYDSNIDSDLRNRYATEADIYKISAYVTLSVAGLVWLWDYSEILFSPNISQKIKLDFEAGIINNKAFPLLAVKLNL